MNASRLAVFACFLVSCDRAPAIPAVASAPAVDSLLLMGRTAEEDLIRADATEASLRTRFGDQNVRADSIELGEGERGWGTALFPDDSTRRLEIVWSDTVQRAKPSVVFLRRASQWRVYPGAGVGTDLRAVENLNGKPFTLLGFGWDYGGTVAGYDGGRLDTLWLPPEKRVVLARLGPDQPRDNPHYGEVQGDHPYSSGSRAMQSLNPAIYEILFFPR